MKLITVAMIAAMAVAGGQVRAQEGGVDGARRTKERLGSIRLDLDFTNAKLGDVIAYLQEYSGLNFHLDADAQKKEGEGEAGVTMRLKNVTLRTALKLVLGPRDLGCVYRDGILVITPKSKLDAQAVTRIYDIRDLLFAIKDFPGPKLDLDYQKSGVIFNQLVDDPKTTFTEDILVDLIKSSVAPRTWDEVPGVSISQANGLLIVSQNRSVHEEVRDLLDRLRQYK